jgi:hypothetical protein
MLREDCSDTLPEAQAGSAQESRSGSKNIKMIKKEVFSLKY